MGIFFEELPYVVIVLHKFYTSFMNHADIVSFDHFLHRSLNIIFIIQFVFVKNSLFCLLEITLWKKPNTN